MSGLFNMIQMLMTRRVGLNQSDSSETPLERRHLAMGATAGRDRCRRLVSAGVHVQAINWHCISFVSHLQFFCGHMTSLPKESWTAAPKLAFWRVSLLHPV